MSRQLSILRLHYILIANIRTWHAHQATTFPLLFINNMNENEPRFLAEM
jgi:hypothetical protein